ncbi:MAG TPA: MBL fold metallo-hydrolase [Negativicutes bacterium]|nr:MBL fold metallo-hydrolase [Negativicutes bacterium]
MGTIQVTFLGSGDAFGAGGRLQPCILVRHLAGMFLIDCGASAMISLRRYGVDPNGLDFVLISHLHGDHFGGIPYLILDGQLVSKRTKPLVLAGPPGLETRWNVLTEASFPGATAVRRQFAVETRELAAGTPAFFGPVRVEPFPVAHMPHDPCYAYRIAVDGRTIAYTGDSEWADAIVSAGREADLLIAEAYYRDKKIRNHLDYAALREHLPAIKAGRVVITHMSAGFDPAVEGVECDYAEDGLTLEI